MANIEESLSISLAARRRKGTSLGSVSSRSSPKLDTIHHQQQQQQSKEYQQQQKATITTAATMASREIISNK